MTPKTLPYTAIELVARNPARGVHRRWRLQAARDLFGRVTVETAWGRIGAPGRTLTRSFAAEDDASCYVRALATPRRRAEADRHRVCRHLSLSTLSRSSISRTGRTTS